MCVCFPLSQAAYPHSHTHTHHAQGALLLISHTPRTKLSHTGAHRNKQHHTDDVWVTTGAGLEGGLGTRHHPHLHLPPKELSLAEQIA